VDWFELDGLYLIFEKARPAVFERSLIGNPDTP